MLYIGVDLGTSAVKLLLMDETGAIKKVVSREYPLLFPHPGWSEQNPSEWIQATFDGIRELTKECNASSVAGIGVGGQMHGLVVLDKDDNVLRPAILWNDGRTSEETDYLNQVIGEKKLAELTSNIAFAGFTAPKVLWMKKNEPDLFKQISKIMLPKDYINYILTGVHCTDCSDASGMLMFSVKDRDWSDEMLEICGVKREMMPKVFESYEKVGTLLPEIAAELGLSASTIVAAGAGDNAAAAVGTGTVGNGACNISVGTSGTIFITCDEYRENPNNSVHFFDHADGTYHLMGCMLSAAACNKWFLEEILKTSDYKTVQSEIREESLGRNQVFFLPYLMGERSPINDTNARATFTGMTMDTSRADMVQAVFEGVAFGIRDSLEVARSLGIDIQKSRICGGGAKSPLWRKIFANICNLEIETIEAEEGPGYGGAMLAMVACGEYPDVRTIANQFVKVTGSEKPDPALVKLYEERYQAFKKLYPALKPVFPVLAVKD